MRYYTPHEGTHCQPHGRGSHRAGKPGAVGHSVRSSRSSCPDLVEVGRGSHRPRDCRPRGLLGSDGGRGSQAVLPGRSGAGSFRGPTIGHAPQVLGRPTPAGGRTGLQQSTCGARALDTGTLERESRRARVRGLGEQERGLPLAPRARTEALAKKSWCVPKLTDEFRERMEDVLTLYEQPHKRTEPVVCLDEQPYQLLDDVRPPTAAAPGQVAKEDHEYRRCGTCNVFMAVEPAAGRRHVWVRRRRAKPDFARVVSELMK